MTQVGPKRAAMIATLVALTGSLVGVGLALLHARQDIEWLNDALRYDREPGNAFAESWAIMQSYGLKGREVAVTIADEKRIAFTGTKEADRRAGLLGPSLVAVLPAAGSNEHVRVAIDGVLAFDKMLHFSDGRYLVVAIDNGSNSVRQLGGILEE